MSSSEIPDRASEESPATSLRRALPLAVVLLCGVAFSAAVAVMVRHQEHEQFQSNFDRQAQIEWRAMQVAIREYEECLYSLRDLFDSSEEVTAAEFRRTTSDLLARHPGLELLAWMPRIRHAERAAFDERAVRADGVRFFIHDEESSAPVPALERAEYLPIEFCEPATENGVLFGLDQWKSLHHATVTRAIESGEISATQRVQLVQGRGPEPGWACAVAVYEGAAALVTLEERRTRWRGLVGGVIPFSRLLAATVGKIPAAGIDFVLFDESSPETERFLVGFIDGKVRIDGEESLGDFRAGLHRMLPMPVAGRHWVAIFRPSVVPVHVYPWVFLGGGILLTTLLMALLHSAQRRTLTVQQLVGERTRELHAAQRTLHEDNQRRRKAEERYRAFVEQSSEAIWRMELDEPLPVDLPEDEQLELYYQRAFLAEANDAFAQMYGFERAKEMLGIRLSDLMPRDRATFEHLRRYVRSGYRLANAESHEAGRNGVKGIFLNNLTGIVEDGRLVRAWGTQRDITEQRAAEDERRRAEARLRSALAAANLGTWEWDVEADVIIWSDTTEQMFGLEPGTFRGGIAEYLRYVHPEDRAGTEVRLRRAMRVGGSLMGELRIVRRDGAVRWLASRGDVVRDEHGRVVRVVGAAMDVTEQHTAAEEKARIERRLQETQKLESLGVLAGGVAHDFNNLLTGILGNTNLAQMDLPEDSPVQANLAAIETTSRRAADLCKQMLAYSGKGRFVVQRLDLSQMVRDTAQLLARPSLTRSVVLEFHLAEKLPAISGDATQLQQIVMNLIINASEALEEMPGTITLTTGVTQVDAACLAEMIAAPQAQPGEYVFFEISDSGCGMDAETLSKIFNPFFSTKFTGRGLGLAAVVGILRGHGGAMKVTSELGNGSTFRLLLPSAGTPVVPPPVVPPPARSPRASGTVLVVDDDPAVRIVARRLLENFGYRVMVAEDGLAAVECFGKDPAQFTAVLLDLTMPRMDGLAAFAEMRRLRADIRVLLMSGYNELDAVSRFSGQGLAAFVQKPFASEELRVAFDRLAAAPGQ